MDLPGFLHYGTNFLFLGVIFLIQGKFEKIHGKMWEKNMENIGKMVFLVLGNDFPYPWKSGKNVFSKEGKEEKKIRTGTMTRQCSYYCRSSQFLDSQTGLGKWCIP